MRLILAVTLTALAGQPASPGAKPVLTKAGLSSWSRLLGTGPMEPHDVAPSLVSGPAAEPRQPLRHRAGPPRPAEPAAKCTLRIVTVPAVDSEMVKPFMTKVDPEMIRPSPCVP